MESHGFSEYLQVNKSFPKKLKLPSPKLSLIRFFLQGRVNMISKCLCEAELWKKKDMDFQ